MTTDNGYKAKFQTIVGKIESLSDKPPEPPPLPQAWSGMFQGYKRDAMYYEKCLKDLRELARDCHSGSGKPLDKEGLLSLFKSMEEDYSDILAAEYELEGVDLDKPNYGMWI